MVVKNWNKKKNVKLVKTDILVRLSTNHLLGKKGSLLKEDFLLSKWSAEGQTEII